MRRLCFAELGSVPPELAPRVDPRSLPVGIVHLGIGAFHRAHQAVFTEDAVAAAGGDWGICGVTQRSADVLEQLAPQDGLYTLLEQSAAGPSARVIGTVRDLLFAAEDWDGLRTRLSAPSTRLVTLTVTEKGYRHDGVTGRLRAADVDLIADAEGRSPRTVVGQLVRGLQARRAADAGPVTLLSCDNLVSNGALLRRLVQDFCAMLPSAQGEPLAEWIAQSVAFPSSMVDRIVPATTPEDRAEVARLLGLEDRGAVVTEPFRQWVVEDTFAAGRPAWELAGAIMTADVAPYEALKLRLLNGSHSAIAYLGVLAGHEYVAEAVREPAIGEFVARLMAEDITPTLSVPAGFDLNAYRKELIDRFGNPALRHRTQQIAMDGTQKLPQRLLGTIRDRLGAGAEPRLACLAVAAWMRFVSAGQADDGTPVVVDDPLAARLATAVAGAETPANVVDALLGVREVFGDDLPADETFRALLETALDTLTRSGASAAVREAVAS
ncbi:MAG TPA: mannitol dehydrogenase family protein [Kribbella sp.]|nr:mannitol dehydrogenase family protein [Kribbella sp.]